LPIRQPERKLEGDVLAERNETNEARVRRDIIGALIVEQIETQLSRQTLEGRVDLVYEHACRAISNSMNHSNILFMPLWRFLDRCLWMFRGSALPKTASILGFLGAGLLSMFLIPMDFDLQGNGKLKPTVERQVFAHADGEVEAVLIKHGQEVKKDQPLVKLKNNELEQQIQTTMGQYKQSLQQAYGWKRQLDSATTLTEAERIRVQQDYNQAEQEAFNRQAELNLLVERQSKLERLSPIDGLVTTWDVEKVLTARPVVTGQVLMTVADPDGDWEIEVMMPEKRMRYLDGAFANERVVKTDEQGQKYLDVEIILMTKPDTKHYGKLYQPAVGQRAELDPEDGAVVRLRCVPNDKALLEISRRPGARVMADVKCGKRSVAFVVFYEVIEWIRANLLF
jgi:3-methyladenine DNA glycosylase Mpg